MICAFEDTLPFTLIVPILGTFGFMFRVLFTIFHVVLLLLLEWDMILLLCFFFASLITEVGILQYFL
jgi:hypothetical protein